MAPLLPLPVPPLAFLGIGDTEMLVILGVALIFFGGERLPEVARGLAKILKEFRKATGEVEREFRRVMDEAENPASTIFKGEPPALRSRAYSPPPAPPVESDDPREAREDEKPAAPPASPEPQPPAPAPLAENRLRQRGEGETDFHSDI